MSNVGDERGIGTKPPDWWRVEFESARWRRIDEIEQQRKAGRSVPDETLEYLGVVLAQLVGRRKAWDHSAVGNFLSGKRCTVEMAEAFSLHYGIPRFEKVLRAATKERAEELEMFLRRWERQPGRPTPGVAARVSEVDAAAVELREAHRDQTRGLPSKDERPNRSRRPRRSAGRG